jgi:DNA-binding Xre family transcriptional regulator
MESTLPRRDGIRIDPTRLDHELARRGITAQELSAAIGVSAVALSHARNGHSIRETTFAKIANGLAQIPVLDGADALLAEPVS